VVTIIHKTKYQVE